MPQMTLPFIRLPGPVAEPEREFIEMPSGPIERAESFEGSGAFASETGQIFYEGPSAVLTANAPATSPNLGLWIVAIWLGVAVTWLLFQLIKQSVFMRRIKQSASPTPQSLEAPILEAMSLVGLRRRPDIHISESVSGPMVTGVLRPLILLPSDFEARFKPAQRSFALVHEMAHIKRGDLWAAFIALCFRALFWPNPLIHYAAHKMRVDQEAACDASVLSRTGGESAAHSYAETLIHAATSATQKTTNRKMPLGLALSDTQLNQERDDDEMA
jgi:beta-lactamase regulating signal transducer with metallopeptidase domain